MDEGFGRYDLVDHYFCLRAGNFENFVTRDHM